MSHLQLTLRHLLLQPDLFSLKRTNFLSNCVFVCFCTKFQLLINLIQFMFFETPLLYIDLEDTCAS